MSITVLTWAEWCPECPECYEICLYGIRNGLVCPENKNKNVKVSGLLGIYGPIYTCIHCIVLKHVIELDGPCNRAVFLQCLSKKCLIKFTPPPTKN